MRRCAVARVRDGLPPAQVASVPGPHVEAARCMARAEGTVGEDADGRDNAETDALGHTASKTFDADGNVATETDAAGKVTTYGYDGQDRVVSTTDANGNTTTEQYDADGAGDTTRYYYDATSQVTSDGGSTYGFDKNGCGPRRDRPTPASAGPVSWPRTAPRRSR